MSLARVALLGTARAGDDARTGTPVDRVVEAAADTPPERRVLLAAGALAVYRRAGYRPRVDVAPLVAPAPAEPLPACPRGAAAAIHDMLSEYRLELLPEAFQVLAGAGFRLPSSLLVDVLDLEDAEIRQAANPVLGERGRWLAAQRAAWSWAISLDRRPDIEDLRQAWEEGRLADRLDAIRHLRGIEPDRARDWIAGVWKGEPSDVRMSLVATLSDRLTPADADWLAIAIKDRTRAVRATAAALLARIAGSPVSARAIARADPLLGWSPQQGGMLVVRPPEAFEPEWDDDGLVARPPRGVGERAWWLTQAVALVDPRYWEGRFDATADAIATAAVQSEWALPVSEGLAHAAVLHDAGAWSAALWDAWISSAPERPGADVRAAGDMLARLFAHMPRGAAAARVPAVIDAAPLYDLDLEAALARFPAPWPESVGVAVLDAIEASLAAQGGPGAARLTALLRAGGRAVPVSLLDRAAAIAANPTAARALRAFDLFARQVALRVRLHQEMRS